MEARFTKAHLVLYANAVGRCMIAEYRYHNERDLRLKKILKEDVEREYAKLTKWRKVLGITDTEQGN